MKQLAARLALAVAAIRSLEEWELFAVVPKEPADSQLVPSPRRAVSLQSTRHKYFLAHPSAEKLPLSCLFRRSRMRNPIPAPLANFCARSRRAKPIRWDPSRSEDFPFDRTLSNARAVRRFDKRAGLFHRDPQRIPRLNLRSPRTKYLVNPWPKPRCISFSDRRKRSPVRPASPYTLFHRAKFPHTNCRENQK